MSVVLIVCLCRRQQSSAIYSLNLSQTVCVCHSQSVPLTDSLCLSQTICLWQTVFICHRQSISVTDSLSLSIRDSQLTQNFPASVSFPSAWTQRLGLPLCTSPFLWYWIVVDQTYCSHHLWQGNLQSPVATSSQVVITGGWKALLIGSSGGNIFQDDLLYEGEWRVKQLNYFALKKIRGGGGGHTSWCDFFALPKNPVNSEWSPEVATILVMGARCHSFLLLITIKALLAVTLITLLTCC